MRYTFNNFTLDLEQFELSEDGKLLHAEPQILALLQLLLEGNGRLISKEEINEKVWKGRIVSEATLSSRIKTLRQILGDDGKTQSVIRTVHKKGFRFLPAVQSHDDAAGAVATEPGAAIPAHTLTSNPIVAVLAFESLSGGNDQDYFAEGISADIITLLSRHRWLHVLARNASFGFKNRLTDARQIGRELGAHYIVEGSVQQLGRRVRVSVSLIDSASGLQTWSDRYDREIDDLFVVQDEITQKITARLEPEIGYAERGKIFHRRPANLKAWDCYHLGVYHFYKFTGVDNIRAQELLKQSLQLDPNFGEAHAWWAYALVLGMVYWDTEPRQELLDEALSATNTALSLDPKNASFFALRARVLLARREYDRAIVENEKAIALNPTFAAAHCGLGDSLAYEGRYDESVSCFETAVSLSPNDPQLWAFYTYGALTFIFKRDFSTAVSWAQQATTVPNCQYWAYAHQAVALAHLGRLAEARHYLENTLALVPHFSLAFVRKKMFYLKKQDQIELYLEGLRLLGMGEQETATA